MVTSTRCSCTHFAGSHAHNGHGNSCTVMLVSGPAVDNDRERLSDADQHHGRIVTRCPCTGYSPTPKPLQDKEI
jgi:predicted nucleic acid-binding Zn finger protein